MFCNNMCVTYHHGMIFRDAGVKGMKKGEHRMARDPEYIEQIRGGGGGGGRRPAKPQKPLQRSPMHNILSSTGKSMAGGAAVGALGSAAGMGAMLASGMFKGAQKKAALKGAAIGAGLSMGLGALQGANLSHNYKARLAARKGGGDE